MAAAVSESARYGDGFSRQTKKYNHPYRTDDDGWQTKVSTSRRTKSNVNESRGSRRPNTEGPYFPGRGGRSEYRGGRQTVYYSRGTSYSDSRGGRRPQKYNYPDSKSQDSSRIERTYRVAQTDRSEEKRCENYQREEMYVENSRSISVAEPIDIALEKVAKLSSAQCLKTAVLKHDDLTPPPPPSCGKFSYRDALAKGLEPTEFHKKHIEEEEKDSSWEGFVPTVVEMESKSSDMTDKVTFSNVVKCTSRNSNDTSDERTPTDTAAFVEPMTKATTCTTVKEEDLVTETCIKISNEERNKEIDFDNQCSKSENKELTKKPSGKNHAKKVRDKKLKSRAKQKNVVIDSLVPQKLQKESEISSSPESLNPGGRSLEELRETDKQAEDCSKFSNLNSSSLNLKIGELDVVENLPLSALNVNLSDKSKVESFSIGSEYFHPIKESSSSFTQACVNVTNNCEHETEQIVSKKAESENDLYHPPTNKSVTGKDATMDCSYNSNSSKKSKEESGFHSDSTDKSILQDCSNISDSSLSKISYRDVLKRSKESPSKITASVDTSNRTRELDRRSNGVATGDSSNDALNSDVGSLVGKNWIDNNDTKMEDSAINMSEEEVSESCESKSPNFDPIINRIDGENLSIVQSTDEELIPVPPPTPVEIPKMEEFAAKSKEESEDVIKKTIRELRAFPQVDQSQKDENGEHPKESKLQAIIEEDCTPKTVVEEHVAETKNETLKSENSEIHQDNFEFIQSSDSKYIELSTKNISHSESQVIDVLEDSNDEVFHQTLPKTLESRKDSIYMSNALQKTCIDPDLSSDPVFPDVSQSWSSDKPDLHTCALPQREKLSQDINEREEGSNMTENISSDPSHILHSNLKTDISNSFMEPKNVWTSDEKHLSADIYSAMPTPPPVEDNSIHERTKGSDIPGGCSLSNDPSKIWSNDKRNIALPSTGILSSNESSVSNLQSLLHRTAPSISLAQSYQVDKSVQLPRSTMDGSITGLESSKRTNRNLVESAVQTSDQLNKIPDLSHPPPYTPNLPQTGLKQPDTGISETNQLGHGSTGVSTAMPFIFNSQPVVQNSQFQSCMQQNPHVMHSQMVVPPSGEVEFGQVPRLQSSQNVSVPQPVAFVPPSGNLPYPNMALYDAQWPRPYQVELQHSDWMNMNRYPGNDRNFQRTQIPNMPQSVSMYNMSPQSAQHQKEQIFNPSYGLQHTMPFQPGSLAPAFMQPLPSYLSRMPPPPFNSTLYGARIPNALPTMGQRLHAPQRYGYDSRDNFSTQGKEEVSRAKPSPPNSLYDGSKIVPTPIPTTGNQLFGDSSYMSSNTRLSPGGKFNRQSGSYYPQEHTLGDFIPVQNEQSSDKFSQENWKRSGGNERRLFNGSRKNFRMDQKESSAYPPLPTSDTNFHEGETTFTSRKKNCLKSSGVGSDMNKSSKLHNDQSKNNGQFSYEKHKVERNLYEKEKAGLSTNSTSDTQFDQIYYASIMPPVELAAHPSSVYGDIKGSRDRINCDIDSGVGSDKTSFENPVGNFEGPQDLCNGGWKYYQETMESSSGLRVHPSTYVPYPNPCGTLGATYVSTNDVRARIQWLGFKKAHSIYSEIINSQKSLRMDVTVVCSKGSAVCCNSDILSTCSSYFYERLTGKTEEYMTIFVNVPSKIMKHFLQMMSGGEAFVPFNDVNEVVMKAPIYLNLTS